MNNSEIININVTDIIDSPYQGRLYEITDQLAKEDEILIQSLTNSIEHNGLMQPIIVRQSSDNKYEVIDGHRRTIAHRRLGRGTIKAIVKNYNDKEAQVFSIIGNLQRKNLNIVENSLAFQKVLNSKYFANTKELAIAIGKDETFVGDILNILKMDERIVDDLIKTKCINDVRILKIIRNNFPLEDGGFSDRQFSVYSVVKNNKYNRAELKKYLVELKQFEQKGNRQTKQRIRFDTNKNSMKLQIDVKNINETKKQKIEDFIKKQIDIMNQTIQEIENFE